jgi:glutathione synthase/RimK-type ligase-like ATP-grasp enzyme
MNNIACVTYDGKPELTADDQLFVAALRERGVAAAAVCWDDRAADWAGYDRVVVRSCWDYVPRAAEFRTWLDHLQRHGTRLLNPASLIEWNMNKRYLAELAARGVDIAPTAWLPQGDAAELAAVLADHGWERAVVKPAISAGGENTWETTAARAAADQPRLDRMVQTSDVLVQPFLPAVTSAGEWSLIFFNGEYSHAVLKRPAAGEFRSQSHHGGSVTPGDPGEALIAQARRALAAAPRTPLYARVDGVAVGGRLILMELEMIEPDLFLGSAPGAAARFAAALLAR